MFKFTIIQWVSLLFWIQKMVRKYDFYISTIWNKWSGLVSEGKHSIEYYMKIINEYIIIKQI